MENNQLLSVLAVVLVALSVLGLGVTMMKASDFNEKITGYETGYVNISITTTVAIDVDGGVDGSIIDFAQGQVDAGKASATVQSTSGGISQTDGNWTKGYSIIINNTGNINVSINISSDKTSTSFFGGTNPKFYLNISNKEAGSCGSGPGLSAWIEMATTSDYRFCDQLSPVTASSEIYLDAKLVVPNDANLASASEDVQATLTITASATG